MEEVGGSGGSPYIFNLCLGSPATRINLSVQLQHRNPCQLVQMQHWNPNGFVQHPNPNGVVTATSESE